MNFKKTILMAAAALVVAPAEASVLEQARAYVNMTSVRNGLDTAKPFIAMAAIAAAKYLPENQFFVEKVLPLMGRSTKEEAQVMGATAGVLAFVGSIPHLKEKIGPNLWFGTIVGFGIHKVASTIWFTRGLHMLFSAGAKVGLFKESFTTDEALDKEYDHYVRYKALAATIKDIQGSKRDAEIISAIKQNRVITNKLQVNALQGDYVPLDVLKGYDEFITVSELRKDLELNGIQATKDGYLKTDVLNAFDRINSSSSIDAAIKAEKDRLVKEEQTFADAYGNKQAMKLVHWYSALPMYVMARTWSGWF